MPRDSEEGPAQPDVSCGFRPERKKAGGSHASQRSVCVCVCGAGLCVGGGGPLTMRGATAGACRCTCAHCTSWRRRTSCFTRRTNSSTPTRRSAHTFLSAIIAAAPAASVLPPLPSCSVCLLPPARPFRRRAKQQGASAHKGPSVGWAGRDLVVRGRVLLSPDRKLRQLAALLRKGHSLRQLVCAGMAGDPPHLPATRLPFELSSPP